MKAEIISCFSCKILIQFTGCLQAMLPGSSTAENFSLLRTSFAFVQRCGTFPYFLYVLEDEIEHSDHYSISFGESMSKITQKEICC